VTTYVTELPFEISTDTESSSESSTETEPSTETYSAEMNVCMKKGEIRGIGVEGCIAMLLRSFRFPAVLLSAPFIPAALHLA